MAKFNDPEIEALVEKEWQRQNSGLELIASENYPSPEVREALASPFMFKYSEGYPGKRYYAGNENVDTVENLACERAKKLFQAEYVNVQPLSGGPANIAVYMAFLEPGDTVLSLALDHGGHLSHGLKANFSGRFYNFIHYHVDPKTFIIDMDEVEKLTAEHKPKMIVAGFSAYSRNLDWQRFRTIADKVGAILFADIAHIAGLIAGKVLENPVPLCDVVGTTTHKTLRGPRGAIIMSKEKYGKKLARAVFPGVQGGPHDHVTLAKAIAFGEALKPEFSKYTKQIISNAQTLARTLINSAIPVLTGGTDNHLLLLDVSSLGTDGAEIEILLNDAGIRVNKNLSPFDRGTPQAPSGIRLGTPALTTRGLRELEMELIGQWIAEIIKEKQVSDSQKVAIKELALRFPIR
ncbi:MAG: serine hydroxymethyltransferase [Candidatus Abawacabacteria bacterium RBG_16_42_10]|uniref:Serine hydroxymethyltransferase n=1 Tax=Candidatus Abawacabacteria bacterium RBG_16_42_10 TaxID=1817814 RepID=A0A1F4XKZ5_9BACT|nr:MAG: serine hydroxymethyltransferase [Candidatus Abawacabacteria bacterium RBG_16_42_10]